MLMRRLFFFLTALAYASVAAAANNAQVVGQSVPASLGAGQTANVSVTVRNTGTTTWSGGGASSAWRLAALPGGSGNQMEWVGFPQCGGYMNGTPTDARVYLCNTVAPGQDYTFTFGVRMPAGATGSRRLAVQMVQDGVQFFGLSSAWNVSVAGGGGGGNNAQVVGQSVPASLAAGATATVSVTVQNTGGTTWSGGGASSPWRLAALPSGSFNQVEWVGFPQCGGYMNGTPTDARIYLCNSVAPGQTYAFTFSIRMPAGAAGVMRLGVQMVQDGVQFFGAPSAWNITVTGGGGGTATPTSRPGAPTPTTPSATATPTIPPGNNQPDLIITNLVAVPGSPAVDQDVYFDATVKNVGNASTPAGTQIGVGFGVGSEYFGWDVRTTALVPGASIVMRLSAGPSGPRWRPVSTGTRTVVATVDDVNRIHEANESNNVATISVTVGVGGGTPPPGATPTPTQPPTNGGGGGLFVKTSGREFSFGGQVRNFVGVNMRGLFYYGDTGIFPYSNPNDRVVQLDSAHNMGARVVRAFAPDQLRNVNTAIRNMCDTLNLARQRNMRVIVPLTDLYASTGMHPQGDNGSYAPACGSGVDILSPGFFAGGYRTSYLPFVRAVVSAFRNDPAVFAWELGNEVKNPCSASDMRQFVSFAGDVSNTIRGLDGNHLITVGSQGGQEGGLRLAPDIGGALYGLRNINFLTIHPYHGEDQDDDTGLGRSLNKPVLVEEVGFTGGDCPQGRAACFSNDMDKWFGRGARGYMPWGFVGPSTPPYDGGGADLTWTTGDFNSIYGMFQGRAAGLGDVPMPGGQCSLTPLTVTQGASTSFAAPMDAGQKSATFVTTWPGSNVVTTLRAPSGRVLSRDALGDDVEHHLGPDWETFTVSGPEVGLWTVELYGADVAPEGEGATFTLATEPVAPADTSAPVITPTVIGTVGANGWYTSDVTVSFAVEDEESGIASSTGCQAVTLTEEMAGRTLTCTATNGAGLTTSLPVPLKIDKRPPAIAITSPAAVSYPRVGTLTLAWTVSEGLSGLQSSVATLDGATAASGQSLDLATFALGAHTLRVEATDRAGNAGAAAVAFQVVATLASLNEALQRACDDGGIASRGICHSLGAKLRAATAAHGRGRDAAAVRELRTFRLELSAQRGKKVSELAYARLDEEARAVIATLGKRRRCD